MMRIEFLTQDDPVYILPFFEEFFRRAGDRFETMQVSCCRTMGGRSRKQLATELICLYGPMGLARLLSRTIAAKTAGAIPRSRDAKMFYSIEQACTAWGVPFKRIGNPNEPAFVDSVVARSADLIVSVACPYIIKPRLLGLPPLGCINIHHAPLPRYKGMMPTFWQLYHGERRVGLTIHYMVEKIDDGEALLQEALPVEAGETLDHLIRRSKRHAAQCLVGVLDDIHSQSQRVIKLDRSQSSYFTFPTLDQIREFHRRGFRGI
jgi:methionyl-tRNA formyltransferase